MRWSKISLISLAAVLFLPVFLLPEPRGYAFEKEREADIIQHLETPDERGNVIPDFSHAGYMGGGVAIPDAPVVKELSPEPEGDDRERIQEALDAVSEMEPDADGFRGALLLRAGEYRVHGYLHIKESGVVLRGEGQGPGGTTITATRRDYVLPGRTRQHSLIYLGRHDDSRVGFLTKENETVLASEAVPVGSREIEVRSAELFDEGDNIVIEVYPNEKWTQVLSMEKDWAGKARGTRTRFYYERKITGISGNKLTLDAPMTFYLDENHLHRALVWSYSDDERISQSGVENLRLKSYFTEENYLDIENYRQEERHAWSGIYVEPVRDCWVRNVTALYFQHAAVQIPAGARNVTVQDCANLRPVSRIAGSRRYAFRTEGTRILFQRNYSRGARHAFASSSAGLGLNVFLDGVAEKCHLDIGPHIKWATGYLYDNILAPQGRIEVRKMRGGHGWRGANQVFWNCRTRQIASCEPETGDTNWTIGCHAYKRGSPRRTRHAKWISHGHRVNPRSLYLYQLERRLGKHAVENITVPVQRQEDSDKIYNHVKYRLAELNDRELRNDSNILSDPGFLHGPAGASWITTKELEKPFEFDEYADDKEPVSALERAGNPVFGNHLAVKVPGDRSLRLMPTGFLSFQNPSREKIGLNFSFDYKMAEGESFDVSVIYNTVRIGTDEEGYALFTYGKTRWERTMVFTGPSAQGTGEWQEYSFNFIVAPEFYDDTNMPYPKNIAVKFSTGSEYAIANPLIEITGDR